MHQRQYPSQKGRENHAYANMDAVTKASEVQWDKGWPSIRSWMSCAVAGEQAQISQASAQCLKYINCFLLFFSCCLLPREVTEPKACLFIMRPEYTGIISEHQLINSRIKGEELSGSDVQWLLTSDLQRAAARSCAGCWQGEMRARAGGCTLPRFRQLGRAPCAIKLNCQILLPFPLSESKNPDCCQATAANETELCGGMFSLPSAVVQESGISDGGPHRWGKQNLTTCSKRKSLTSH